MTSPGPTRRQSDLAEMIEMLLDKGVVINADVVVSVGDTELLGVHIRAALASFETAAEYGLAFPEGTDMDRVEAAAERSGGDQRVEAGEGRNVTEQLKLGPPGGGWQEEYAERENEEDGADAESETADENEANDEDDTDESESDAESEEAEAAAPEATGGGDGDG